MKKVALLVILLIAAQVTFAVVAARGSARTYLNQFVDNLENVSASFTQKTTDANGHEGQQSSGTLALASPDLFRWHVQKPYEQLIVADGKTVWVYDPDLDQVSKQDQAASASNSPLSMLTDLDRLDRDYASEEKGTKNGLAWLRLTPKKTTDASFAYIDLGLDVHGLEKMIFKDQVGSRATTTFSEWKRNSRLPKDTFRFTPPADVDVIETGTSTSKGQASEVMPLDP